MSFPPPFTVSSGSVDPQAPLVVLCHGIGEDETMFDHVVSHLPQEFAIVQVRGPVEAGRGHNWFERRQGRIHQPSLDRVSAWFEAWLDEVAPPGRPVVVVGFSAGSAFAGSLALRAPERYVGAAVLSGAIPLDNLPSLAVPGRLTGLPVFLTVSAQDRVIREEFTRTTWDYLVTASGAGVTARVDPGGHEVTEATAVALGHWLDGLLASGFVAGAAPAHGVVAELSDSAVASEPVGGAWTMLPQGLPERSGNRPRVAWAPPHQQWSDQSHDAVRLELHDRVSRLPGVEFLEVSDVVPGQVAVRTGGREFARMTPLHDTSVRVALPHDRARELVTKGWAQVLPANAPGAVAVSDTVTDTAATSYPVQLLVYGPRTKHELDVVTGLLAEAHHLPTH